MMTGGTLFLVRDRCYSLPQSGLYRRYLSIASLRQ